MRNSLISPKRLAKGSFEGLEAYQFPPPGRTACGNGFNFLSADSDSSRADTYGRNDLSYKDKIKVPDEDLRNAMHITPGYQPMSPEQIAAIDRTLQGIVFMIDCDLCQPHDADLFERFFGDQTLRETKDWFLARVREKVWSLLNRGRPTEMPFQHNLRIVEVGEFEGTLGTGGCEARVLYGYGRMCAELEINRRVHKEVRSINEFHLTRLELTKTKLFREGFRTREGVLLHDFVHHVSYALWDGLISRIGIGPFELVNKVIRIADETDDHAVVSRGPGRIVDVAFDQVPSRNGLINAFIQLHSKIQGHDIAYGHLCCCVLARYSFGMKGAIFNADSWSQYVQARAYKFLGQVLRPDQDSELMKHDDRLLRGIRDSLRSVQEALWQLSHGKLIPVPQGLHPFAVREVWFKPQDGVTQAFYHHKRETVRQLMQIRLDYKVKSTSKSWYTDGHLQIFSYYPRVTTGVETRRHSNIGSCV